MHENDKTENEWTKFFYRRTQRELYDGNNFNYGDPRDKDGRKYYQGAITLYVDYTKAQNRKFAKMAWKRNRQFMSLYEYVVKERGEDVKFTQAILSGLPLE